MRQMSSRLIFLFVLVLIFTTPSIVSSSLHTLHIEPTIGEPWPQPQFIHTTTQRFSIPHQTFQFLITESSERCDLLTSAFVRYYHTIFFAASPPSSHKAHDSIDRLLVSITQPCDEWPSLRSNESCNLTLLAFR